MLNDLLNQLFPPGNALVPVELGDCEEDRVPVAEEEVTRAIAAKTNTNTAPGPDGLKATVLRKLPPTMIARLAQCFNIYLKHGIFPVSWKTADLVLIPKGEIPPGDTPKGEAHMLIK